LTPEVAAALLRSHLEDFFANSPRVRNTEGWDHEITDNPVVAIVKMPARTLNDGNPDIYTLRLDGTFYDTWPVAPRSSRRPTPAGAGHGSEPRPSHCC
jgi:hypothetical protein